MISVIYYPYLSPEPEWLRRAALCWDEVYRLRPHDAPDDPEEIVILNEALGGLLKSDDPRHWVDMDSETKIGFITWLKDRMMRLQAGLITQGKRT